LINFFSEEEEDDAEEKNRTHESITLECDGGRLLFLDARLRTPLDTVLTPRRKFHVIISCIDLVTPAKW